MSEVRPLKLARLEPSKAKTDWMQPRSTAVRTVDWRSPQPAPHTVPPPCTVPPPRAPTTPPPTPDAREVAGQHASLAGREEALAQGLHQLEQSRAELERELDATRAERERFVAAIAEMLQAQSHAVAALEAPLLDLSVNVAEAILGAAIDRSPELHASLARAALEVLGDVEGARIRVSAETHRAIVQTRGAAEILYEGIALPVVLDAGLGGLGCVVEAGRSRVDARVRERLDAVREALVHAHRAGVDR